MPDPAYLSATVAVAAVVTFTLRALPFALLSPLRSSPTIDHLARRLPAGVMVILVVYLLRDTPLTRPPYGLVQLLPVAVTVAVHLWRRRMLASIGAGTLTYALVLAIAR
jgi:branched chain amino acid efflux pump